jgi:chaperonin GroES
MGEARRKQMQPRLLKSAANHEFKLADYNGTNESGYQPLGDSVLVAFDVASDVTSGGIILPEDMTEKMTLSAETGVIVALGSDAFLWNGDRTRKWEGTKPHPGDRVYMERYSGQLLHGDDGKIYRLCSDKCIGAVRAETAK